MSSIRLSEKHGVNPSVEQCFYCMKDVGVILFGKMKEDKEAPRQVCLGPNSEPCTECKEWMEQGVILVSVDEEKSDDPENPWRTGGWIVVVDKAIRDMVQPEELAETILEQRFAFVPDTAWEMLGLPRG